MRRVIAIASPSGPLHSGSNPHSRRRAGQTRRGVLTAWTVFAMLMAGCCAALVWNQLWISGIRSDALRCAEAAALVAGHELLSDEMLRAEQHEFEAAGREFRSRQAALTLADQYRRSTGIPALAETDIHFLHGSVRPEHRAENHSTGLPYQVTVRFGADNEKNRVALFLSGLTGISNAAVAVQATALLEHHPSGFAPSRLVSVPMVPLCIPDEQSSGTGSWSNLIEASRGQDRYSWNADRDLVEAGADGLPEITLLLSCDSAARGPGQLVPLTLCREPLQNGRFEKQVMEGISLADLADLGRRQIDFPCSVPNLTMGVRQLGAVADALAAVTGRPLIWCLSESASEPLEYSSQYVAPEDSDGNSPGTAVRLTRPVAARILNVRMFSPTVVQVTLQPCVLVTATALNHPAQPTLASRYIHSVRLMR